MIFIKLINSDNLGKDVDGGYLTLCTDEKTVFFVIMYMSVSVMNYATSSLK